VAVNQKTVFVTTEMTGGVFCPTPHKSGLNLFAALGKKPLDQLDAMMAVAPQDRQSDFNDLVANAIILHKHNTVTVFSAITNVERRRSAQFEERFQRRGLAVPAITTKITGFRHS
jgi:hypothetical protein